MRKRIFTALLASVVLLGSCMNDIDSSLGQIERRVTYLENLCKQMNESLKGLQDMVDALQEHDFINKVTPVYQGGEIVGYTISFTHASPITIYNGTDAGTPQLGVEKGEDGVYYWTVTYPGASAAEFIYDNFGQRIPTSAATPQLKIENGNWMVTYDGGKNWSVLGKATGEDGTSFLNSVINKGDYVQFNLINGTTIELPYWDSYVRLHDAAEKANENLESFRKLASEISEKDYADNVIPIMSGQDTIGYRLHLSNGQMYAFYNGTGTNIPVISARPLTNDPGETDFYWSIRYGSSDIRWILDDKGNKIKANAPEGLAVHLSLLPDKDGKYYWAIAYGDGEPQFLLCDGQKVLASVEAPDAVVKNVIRMSDGQFYITVGDSQTICIPVGEPLTVRLSATITNNTITMAASDTVTITFEVSPADEKTSALPVVSDSFYATASPTSPDFMYWRLDIISPSSFKSGSTKLTLLVSDGKGRMKNTELTINYKAKK